MVMTPPWLTEDLSVNAIGVVRVGYIISSDFRDVGVEVIENSPRNPSFIYYI